MLSLYEDLSVVWEPAYLIMSWHVPCLPKWKGGRNISVKNFAVGQKIFILKSGSIMWQVNFLKGVQGIFGENRKLHNCSVINLKHTSKDSVCTKIN